MFRHRLLDTSIILRGAPRRKYPKRVVIHGSERPAYPHDINFNELNLQYTPKPIEFVTKSGWTQPPESLPELPFFVERTPITKAIPVYTDYKGAGTKVITVLRRCGGDIDVLKSEMEKVCQREVEIHPGTLKVKGNYHLRLKKWLAGLGF